jgi:predicted enzyme related to lactoylglutathione lyase
MSDDESFEPKLGTVNWRDLTVPDAELLAEFYRDVAGWEVHPTSMGDYVDYSMMIPGTDEVVAGICHARDHNADLPPQWLIYITVEDAEESARLCVEYGGKLISGPRKAGDGTMCLIEDPAGAVAALYSVA